MPDSTSAFGSPDPTSLESAILRERLAAAEDERCGAEARAVELERRLDEVTRVCTALERVHGTTEHAEVLRAIEDVVVNLVGSEDLAIYERSGDGTELAAVQSMGSSGAWRSPVRVGEGPIGAAAGGQAWLSGEGGGEADPGLSACLPLTAEGRVVGVLAVGKLLPHKPALLDADRRVLRALARHAGQALVLTDLAARARQP